MCSGGYSKMSNVDSWGNWTNQVDFPMSTRIARLRTQVEIEANKSGGDDTTLKKVECACFQKQIYINMKKRRNIKYCKKILL